MNHPVAFKIRLIVSLVMLFLGFVGVVVTDILKDGAWDYWRALCIFYAAVSLIMNAVLKRMGWERSLVTLWHELAHWAGLLCAIFIVSYVVKLGIIGRYNASIEVLTLLALATYLAGVYIESTYILLGIALGVFALAIAFLTTYFYLILVPLMLIVAFILFWMLRRSHREDVE